VIGPEKLEPDTCPNGLTFQVYGVGGELILTRSLNVLHEVESAAEVDAMFAGQVSPEGVYVVVAYDGDTGERMGVFISAVLP
jgi:hypothetical protein